MSGEPNPVKIEDVRRGPLVFSIALYSSGEMTFTLPNHPDPQMREILFRGYFDKIRETILARMNGHGSILS